MANAESARQQWNTSSNPGLGTSTLSSLLDASSSRINSTISQGANRFWPLGKNTPSATDLESQQDTSSSTSSSYSSWMFGERSSSGSSSVLNWNKRFKWFVLLMLVSALFFALAFFFLSFILIRPSKFALSFTFGSVCFMGAFALLKGPRAYLSSLVKDRSTMLFTFIYFFSLGCTLYSCLVLGSYIMVVLSALFQMIALSWYGLRALPGGSAGLNSFARMFFKSSRMILSTCWRKLTSM